MTQEDQIVGFVGAGNMATAIIKGLLQSGVYNTDRLIVSDKDRAALQRLAESFGLRSCFSNSELVRKSSTILLCIKPQNMWEVLDEVKGEIREDHLLISIAAGIPLKMIRSRIDRDIPIIRVMPNTPALVQKGVSALAGGQRVTSVHMAAARMIFDAVGATVQVEEEVMDAVTAVSGSGPGYVFRIMESMVEAGKAVGLETDTALALVLETFLGAASLAKESGRPLAQLREMVTSPGGTTAAGLAMLDERGLDKLIHKAVEAACNRSIELGKDY